MERSERGRGIVGPLVNFIILVVVLATLMTIALFLFDRILTAAIIGTAVVALLLLLVVLATAQISRRQTIETMQIGADIALRAQETNDTWDARKTKAIGDVMKEGIRFSRDQARQRGIRPGSQPLPPLLPPSQDTAWLPEITHYDDEIIEIEEPE